METIIPSTDKDKLNNDRWTLAYHEAGHTVMGYLMGVEAEVVNVGIHAGETHLQLNLGYPDGDEIAEYALAGAVADGLFSGHETTFE